MSEAFIKSVCWTLVHSLWIGLVAAAIGAIVIVATRHKSSVMRYNFLLLTGVLFMLSIAYVFYAQQITIKPATPVHEAHLTTGQTAVPVLVMPTTELQQQRIPVLERVAGFLNTHASLVVMVWFIFFLLKLAGIANAFRHIYRVKTSRLNTEPAYWNEKVHDLRIRIGITRFVRLIETPLVKVPSVIGYFKPVIFVPVGLLANLPAEEAEAILLHELAHIRRKDYLVNVAQHLLEAVFFFNPGIIWLSSQLKTERENCCDDMAIAITRNKTGFVKALVAAGIYDNTRPALALKFGNKKTHLLDRAKRILLNNNKSLNTMEKTIMSVGIVAAIALAMAFSPATAKEKKLKDKKAPETGIETAEENALMAMLQQNPDSLKKNGRKEKVDRRNKDEKKEQKTSDEAAEAVQLELENQRLQMEQARLDMEKARLEMERARLNMKDVDWEKMREEMRQAEIEMKKIDWEEVKKEMENAQKQMAGIDWAELEKEMKNAEIEMKNAKEEMKNAQKEMEIAAKELKEVGKFQDELKKDAGVSTLKSYILSDDELIVNGKKQSDELHKKYKAKYLKEKGSVMCMNCILENGKVITKEE